MLFNSYIFIFLFLPLALLGYYLCNANRKYELGKAWLTVMSLWFYGYFNHSYLLIMLASILVNFGIYRWIQSQKGIQIRTAKKTIGRKGKLLLGLCFNLGVLFYFKYYDFFFQNINEVFGSSYNMRHILLPLGISFFTFQQISFLIDTYREDIYHYSFLDYALFVTFFPQLIAGPIVTHEEMICQFQDEKRKKIDMSWVSRGMLIFILGLFKKVIVADTFGRAVDYGFNNISTIDATNGIFLALFYTLQLYYDFSGYCDMARGIGWMFHIEIPVNFNSPYKSQNIHEFWRRWHITLGRFFTKYVYIPLGGNRKGMSKTCINLLLVFFISGIWHGANWTFILWGCMHGIANVIYRVGKKGFDKLPVFIGVLGTFLFNCGAWIVFRATSVTQAVTIWKQILQLNFGRLNEQMMAPLNLDEFWYVLKVSHLDQQPYSKYYIGIAFTLIVLLFTFFSKNVNELAEVFRLKKWNAIALSGILVWCVLSLSEVGTFLYFNF